MKIFSRLFITLAAAFAIVLAIANRGPVTVSLDPLPFEIDGPFYAILLVALFVGVILGAAAGWTASLKWRRIARRQRRELAALEKRHNEKRHNIDGTEPNGVQTSPVSRTTPDDPGISPNR